LIKTEWNKLIKVEPRLLDLAKQALDYKRNSRKEKIVCANNRWYGYGEWEHRGIKQQLILLVGWEAEKPELRTTAAYDIAYSYLSHLLPDCKNCNCLTWEDIFRG